MNTKKRYLLFCVFCVFCVICYYAGYMLGKVIF